MEKRRGEKRRGAAEAVHVAEMFCRGQPRWPVPLLSLLSDSHNADRYQRWRQRMTSSVLRLGRRSCVWIFRDVYAARTGRAVRCRWNLALRSASDNRTFFFNLVHQCWRIFFPFFFYQQLNQLIRFGGSGEAESQDEEEKHLSGKSQFS